MRQVAVGPLEELVTGPQGQPGPIVPPREGGVRLHHRMRDRRRGIGPVDRHRRRCHRSFEVARGRVLANRRQDRANGEPSRSSPVLGIEASQRLLVRDPDQRGGIARLLERLRDDKGDWLAVIEDAIILEFGKGAILPVPLHRRIAMGEDKDDAGRTFCGSGVDAGDPPASDTRLEDEADRRAGRDRAVVARIGRAASDLERPFDPGVGPADRAAVVYGVGTGIAGEEKNIGQASSSPLSAPRRSCSL